MFGVMNYLCKEVANQFTPFFNSIHRQYTKGAMWMFHWFIFSISRIWDKVVIQPLLISRIQQMTISIWMWFISSQCVHSLHPTSLSFSFSSFLRGLRAQQLRARSWSGRPYGKPSADLSSSASHSDSWLTCWVLLVPFASLASSTTSARTTAPSSSR